MKNMILKIKSKISSSLFNSLLGDRIANSGKTESRNCYKKRVDRKNLVICYGKRAHSLYGMCSL